MPEFICATCGNRTNGDTCPICSAVMPYVTTQAKVVSRRDELPAHDDEAPSILKEHHHSFLRIFVSFFLIWMVLIALLAFFAWLGAQRAF